MNQSTVQTASGMPLRIGVLGAGGQLGTCLARVIDASACVESAFATTRTDLDLTDLGDLDAWLDENAQGSLDAVINAAAHTRVDACESEVDLAYQVNAHAPGIWARILAERGVRFLHVSTDYVFAGDENRPYREEDPTDPKTVYGASKRAGEVAVLEVNPASLIVRTSWVFGPGRNFVGAILQQAAKRRRREVDGPLRVVDDQLGSPTSAADLATALVRICIGENPAHRDASGFLHLRNAGETTWYGFAREILARSGYDDIPLEPVATSAFETKAPRPAYSVLDCARASQMGLALRPWVEALAGYLSGADGSQREQLENTRNWPAHEVQR